MRCQVVLSAAFSIPNRRQVGPCWSDSMLASTIHDADAFLGDSGQTRCFLLCRGKHSSNGTKSRPARKSVCYWQGR